MSGKSYVDLNCLQYYDSKWLLEFEAIALSEEEINRIWNINFSSTFIPNRINATMTVGANTLGRFDEYNPVLVDNQEILINTVTNSQHSAWHSFSIYIYKIDENQISYNSQARFGSTTTPRYPGISNVIATNIPFVYYDSDIGYYKSLLSMGYCDIHTAYDAENDNFPVYVTWHSEPLNNNNININLEYTYVYIPEDNESYLTIINRSGSGLYNIYIYSEQSDSQAIIPYLPPYTNYDIVIANVMYHEYEVAFFYEERIATDTFTITVEGTNFEEEYVATIEPALSVEIVDTTDSGPYAIGDIVDLEFIITNTGNVTLSDIEISFYMGGSTWSISSLDPGSYESFGTYFEIDNSWSGRSYIPIDVVAECNDFELEETGTFHIELA